MPDLKLWGQMELDRMRRDLDRLFETLCLDYGLPLPAGPGESEISVSEGPKALVVTARLPGLKAKDLDLTVTGLKLTISCARTESFPGGSRSSALTREISLPCPVDPDAARAVVKDDMLEITLPKISARPRRTVPVNPT
ncbi:MAG: Hsp20/alpha crystallin family protein [Desulfovibrionaceae bacterium]|nr:Hsp20/alpha crystallin family protein [Desulfovibrionaceae bacterium]